MICSQLCIALAWFHNMGLFHNNVHTAGENVTGEDVSNYGVTCDNILEVATNLALFPRCYKAPLKSVTSGLYRFSCDMLL